MSQKTTSVSRHLYEHHNPPPPPHLMVFFRDSRHMHHSSSMTSNFSMDSSIYLYESHTHAQLYSKGGKEESRGEKEGRDK